MATIYRRNDRWYMQWRLSGSLRRKCLGKISKRQAETILHAKEVELRTGHDIMAGVDGGAFWSFALQYLDWHRHEYPDSTDRIRQIVVQHLGPEFSDVGLAAITPHHVERYKIGRRGAGAAVGTVNKELRTLSAIMRKAVEWGKVGRNPIQAVKQLRETESSPPRFYTAGELDSIYRADAIHADVWRLLANTGLRRSEAQALRWADVSADRIRVLSTSMSRTKSGKWRDIPLSPGAKIALDALAMAGSEHVLPQMNGDSLSRAFRKAVERAGLDGNLHCLRHTFCSHLVMAGIPLRTVQVLAGHASFRTTEGYAHLAPEHLLASVSGLNI